MLVLVFWVFFSWKKQELILMNRMEIWDYPFPPHRGFNKCPQGLWGNIDKTEANTQQINMRWVTNDLIFPVWGLAWNEPMEVQFQFRAATSVGLQPEKVKYHGSNSAGTAAGAAQPRCQAVEEVRMWWGTRISPSFTWRVKEGIFHRMGTGRKSWSGSVCVPWQEQHSCSPRGTGDKSHITCDDMGLGSKIHNPKCSILNHWQTPWKVWKSLGVKTSVWLSQPYHRAQLCHQTEPVSLQGLQEHLLVLL